MNTSTSTWVNPTKNVVRFRLMTGRDPKRPYEDFELKPGQELTLDRSYDNAIRRVDTSGQVPRAVSGRAPQLVKKGEGHVRVDPGLLGHGPDKQVQVHPVSPELHALAENIEFLKGLAQQVGGLDKLGEALTALITKPTGRKGASAEKPSTDQS